MELSGRYAEIRFVDQAGAPAEPGGMDQTQKLPVMDVRFIPPGSTSNSGIPGLALVDTGCDFTHVAPSILDATTDRHVRPVSVAGVSGGIDTHAFDCTVLIPLNDGSILPVETDAIRSLGIEGRAYVALIGRSLFQHGRLVMDYKARIFRFYID